MAGLVVPPGDAELRRVVHIRPQKPDVRFQGRQGNIQAWKQV